MQLRIHAVDDRRVMLVDDSGRVRPGRFAARDPQGVALPDGEVVRDHDHYRRHGRRGDLVVEEVAS